LISVDRRTVIQILGTLMCKPQLLNDIDKYQIDPNEFPLPMDKYIYSSIYNLYAGGAEVIHAVDIDTYLQTNELAKKILEDNNGLAFIQDCETYAEPENFAYYYNRFKKFSLLRDLQKSGKDISNFYCDDPLNLDADKINSKFEQLKPNDIINSLKGEIATLENKYSTNSIVEEMKASDGIRDLIKELKIKPEVGVPLQGDIFNTISRGGRRGKLYLRSAASGVGKSRTMVGDACSIAYPIRYEPKYGKWIATGTPEKVLYIMTEQEMTEIQTMILAYLTGINEEAFLYGTFSEEHLDRIEKAIKIMEDYQDYMLCAQVPDPCSSIIKNLFRKYNFQNNVEYFFYDYIFSSPAMLNEYRDLAIREDVCLRMFTTTLKNLAVELNAFILTSTQLSNMDDDHGGFKDQRHIQGSRAIYNLVDLACIMSRPAPEELKLVEGVQSRFNFTPNLIIDIFKNRRGRWTNLRVWSSNDLGTLRRQDLFVTTPDNKPIDDFQIIDFTFDKTQEMKELEELYNDGVIPDEMVEQILLNFEEETQNTKLIDAVQVAFGNEQERRKQVHDADFADFLI
jgi:replicative DNA helicase